jgi:hypothetical protein
MKTVLSKTLATIGLSTSIIASVIFVPYYTGVFVNYLSPASDPILTLDYWGVGLVIIVVIGLIIAMVQAIYRVL